MNKTQRAIAAGLEDVFKTRGFSAPSVPELTNGAGVSLPTLRKYFPSREDMVVGALDYRQARYLSHLAHGMPAVGPAAAFHIIRRLGVWMAQNSSDGCLFFQALSAHPESRAISETVLRHKTEIVDFLMVASGDRKKGQQLYVIHEGITAAWPTQGDNTLATAGPLIMGIFKKAANC